MLPGILALLGVLFFCGTSMAGVCSELGLANGCVTTPDLRNNAVRTNKIANGAVTAAKLESDLAARIAALLQFVTIEYGDIDGMPGPHVIITGANLSCAPLTIN